jgi:hypothetical protein
MDKRTAVRLSQIRGTRILGPSVAQSNRTRLGSTTDSPSEGLFCIVRYHGDGSWKPFIYRFDEFPRFADSPGCENRPFVQSDLWEQFILSILAVNWSDALELEERQLEDALLRHCNAFPHGRVARVSGETKYNIFHGDDLMPFMGISQEAVEGLFSVRGTAHWVHDECEDCQTEDRDAVRKILRLPEWENWRAV